MIWQVLWDWDSDDYTSMWNNVLGDEEWASIWGRGKPYSDDLKDDLQKGWNLDNSLCPTSVKYSYLETF